MSQNKFNNILYSLIFLSCINIFFTNTKAKININVSVKTDLSSPKKLVQPKFRKNHFFTFDKSSENEKNSGQTITTSAFQYPIKSSDFSTPLTSTAAHYTIKNRGRYYLANDISARSNSQTDSTMLKITASNVTLDMNNKTMRPSEGSNSVALTAISIANSLSNVTIKNGQISGTGSTSNTSE